MAKIRCPNCGVENLESAQFCSKCGAPLQGGGSLIPEDICERRMIVYKPLVDPSVAKIAGEQEKIKLFTRFRLFKPKPEEIQFVSLEESYEPYILVNGTYSIDYCREGVYTININDEVKEVILLGQAIEPEPIGRVQRGLGGKTKKITLVGEERIIYEEKAHLLLDKEGGEVPLDEIPPGPSEEDPEKVLEEFGEEIRVVEVSPEREVEILRSRIAKRPPKIKRIISELFQISERIIVYVPIYKILYRNIKKNEEKTLKINGITAKIIS